MARRGLAVIVAILAICSLPSHADAAVTAVFTDVGGPNTKLTITGDSGGSSVAVACSSGSVNVIGVAATGGPVLCLDLDTIEADMFGSSDGIDLQVVTLATGFTSFDGADVDPGTDIDNVSTTGFNDTITTDDGEFDVINCGAGDDVVTADPDDDVDADCERFITSSDTDGDRVLDETDECDDHFAVTSSGCTEHERTLTLKYSSRKRKWSGVMNSPTVAACEVGRAVLVSKEGFDDVFVSAETGADGSWSERKRGRSGKRYYARSDNEVLGNDKCLSVTSNTVKVR